MKTVPFLAKTLALPLLKRNWNYSVENVFLPFGGKNEEESWLHTGRLSAEIFIGTPAVNRRKSVDLLHSGRSGIPASAESAANFFPYFWPKKIVDQLRVAGQSVSAAENVSKFIEKKIQNGTRWLHPKGAEQHLHAPGH
jgi:hypothetical protein